MSRTVYDITLKGYVGDKDFDRTTVDRVLAKKEGREVNVLIDSLGGSLATALSISAAFRNHGDVNVHFTGLNASAATIASLGARRISIDAGAMYLVHRCSAEFVEWGTLNSEQFANLIADCEKIRADLDKMDLNCAQLYAARCRRKPEELLSLMAEGGWLTAKEALAWGFVDEITDHEDEAAPELTDTLAASMSSAGIPLPDVPFAVSGGEGVISRLAAAIAALLRRRQDDAPRGTAEKTYPGVCAALGLPSLKLADGRATLTDGQLSALDGHIAALGRKAAELEASIPAKEAEIAALKAKVGSLPAAATTAVVETGDRASGAPASAAEAFVLACGSARRLFGEV